MYNTEIKESYLHYLVSSSFDFLGPYTKELFDVAQKFEEQANSDIAYFSEEKILEVYTALDLKSINVLRQKYILSLNKYIGWFKEKVDATVKKNIISTEKLYECLSEKNISWKHFSKEAINAIISNLNQITSAFIVYAIYSGLRGTNLEELILLKESDINLSDKTVAVHRIYNDSIILHRIIHVNDIFIELAQKANTEMEFYDDRGRLLGTYEDSPFIIKRRTGTPQIAEYAAYRDYIKVMHSSIKSRIDRMNSRKNSYENLSISSLHNSGIVNYMEEIQALLNYNPLTDEYNMIVKSVAEKYGVSTEKVKKLVAEKII